ncbi:MAG: methylmalonyl-CoA epimerase [Candidatus Mucispirillum faecigallinarum]|nr:methylmalonyl-CoA epimerase [Candidatus Mucispirillum faecigallinarum]
MLLKKIDHIGVAVKSIEAALPLYTAMGADVNHIEEVPSQKVKTAFIKVGETTIELVEATSDESPIAKYLEKNREGLHHICFEVEDIKASLAELKKADIKLIDEEPKVGAHNMLVAFVHPKGNNGVLTELAQHQK